LWSLCGWGERDLRWWRMVAGGDCCCWRAKEAGRERSERKPGAGWEGPDRARRV
jgi:hypothetical protein